LLWPLVRGRAFATFNFEYPENLLGEASAGNTLVSSPALLKRIGHLTEPAATAWNAVFTSGGLLPAQAAADVLRLLGCCPAEVLGSTETSGVAWRQQQPGVDEHWHTLPEVRVRQDDEGFLLLGRGDHIVKIEEKRVSLAEIEQFATQLPTVSDAAAAALDDGVRQCIGLVVQLSEAGRSELDDQGRKRLSNSIRRALRGKLDPVAVPKKYRYVDAIPVNPQGKRQPAVIQELFEQS
jgi:acyl-coenzyme A synthetase/AMP-(fatty) acid ligase